MKNWFPFILSAMISGEALAAPACPTHIQININSESDSGTWESYAHYSSETGTMVLPDNQCKPVSWFTHTDPNDSKSYIQMQKPLWVDQRNPVMIGHQNTPGGDFWGTITVTMTWQPDNHKAAKELHTYMSGSELKRSTSPDPVPPAKTCVFYIAASGPAQPVTGGYGFHGAQCDWEVKEGAYYLNAK